MCTPKPQTRTEGRPRQAQSNAAEKAFYSAKERGKGVSVDGPPSLTINRTASVYAERDRAYQKTGVPHEVDHIVPLAAGGEHRVENLRVIPRTENNRKGAQHV